MPAAQRNRLQGKQVLLVDDDPDIRRFVGAVLKFEGAILQAAASGERALEILEVDRATELVILDLDLPGISGWEVLARLAESRPELKIVLFTAGADADVADRGVAQGALGCILKPVSAARLVESISSLAG